MLYKDLATVRDVITDIFHWPKNREEWKQYKLSNERLIF